MKRIALLIVLASLAAACGGKDGNPNSPSAQPQPLSQSVVGTVASFGATSHVVGPLPRGGTMTLTLTWPGGGDLDFYLTPVTCSDFQAPGCVILVTSDAASGASETILRSVTQGESYKVWVDSFVGSPRNYTIDISVR